MLEEIDFLKWASKLNLSGKSQNYILKIRNSEPSRRVSSGRGSVSGRFPSRKMGFTIQFESHKNELAYIYILEHDKKVFEYYDQPPQIPLKYATLKGRKIGFNHTPDFFILHSDWAGWVECKTEDQLLELAVKQPNRFCLNEHGDWSCPPGESYASQFGLEYRVWSSKSINKTYQQNIEYLEDYFRTDIQISDDKTNQKIISKVSNKFGISLSELYYELEEVITRDEILSLISKEQIFVDFYESPLSSPESVKVFIGKEAAKAYSSIFQLNLPFYEKSFKPQVVEIEVGKQIIWDTKVWKIANLGVSNITLIDDSSALSEIPIRLFEELVHVGKIKGLQTFKASTSKVTNLLKSASSENLAQANFRQSVVLAFLQGE
jgi:putative transposase